MYAYSRFCIFLIVVNTGGPLTIGMYKMRMRRVCGQLITASDHVIKHTS